MERQSLGDKVSGKTRQAHVDIESRYPLGLAVRNSKSRGSLSLEKDRATDLSRLLLWYPKKKGPVSIFR